MKQEEGHPHSTEFDSEVPIAGTIPNVEPQESPNNNLLEPISDDAKKALKE